MIVYLIDHFKISLLLAVFFLLLSKIRWMSNRTRLVLFYLILLKSLLPWGFVDFSATFFNPHNYGAGFSFDLPSEVGAGGHDVFTSAVADDRFILLGWGFFFLLNLLFILRGFYILGAKVKGSSPCGDPVICELTANLFRRQGGRPPFNVVTSKTIPTPFIWWNGCWSIVLPESFLALSRDEKRIVLAHEIAHIQRGDFIKFIFLKGIKALFFFSPLVRLLTGEILSCEETETDLKAMRQFGISPVHFGETILHVLGMSAPASYPVPTLIRSSKRRLKMRLERLFQKKTTKNAKRIQATLVISALLISAVNFSSTAIAERDADAGEFISPLAESKLTLGFGEKTHPITKEPYLHNGVDLAASLCTDIVSPAKGTVLDAGYNDNRGNFLVIQHDGGYTTLYSHLSGILVSEGDNVDQGQEIATVGNSGLSTGPHLHFEIRKNNEAIDPLGIITPE